MKTQTQIYLEGNPGTGWQFAGSCKTADEAQEALKLMQDQYPQCEWRIVYPTESARTPQTQFTPGPWIIESTPSGAFDIYSSNDCDARICELIDGPANAALIASAPSLYAALQALLESFPVRDEAAYWEKRISEEPELMLEPEELALMEAVNAARRALDLGSSTSS